MPHGKSFIAYRGQKDVCWSLVPSLFRAFSRLPNKEAMAFDMRENLYIAQFFDKARPYLNQAYDGTNFWDIIIAQHYGLPTRLLDVSADPHVALFFASSRAEEDRDGAVFLLMPTDGAQNFYNRSRAPNAQNFDSFLGDRPMMLIEPPVLDQRITAQKSKFIVSPSEFKDGNYLPLDEREDLIGSIIKYKVPHRCKRNILRELDCIGVSESTLFPGISSIASVLKSEMEDAS